MSAYETGNGDPLPPVEWEVLAMRAQVPADLQEIMRATTSTLRVPHNIDRKIRSLHADTLPYYQRLTETLIDWAYYRPDPKEPQRQWHVFTETATLDQRGNRFWVRTVLGFDRGGSLHLITMHVIAGPRFMRMIEQELLIARETYAGEKWSSPGRQDRDLPQARKAIFPPRRPLS